MGVEDEKWKEGETIGSSEHKQIVLESLKVMEIKV